MSTEDLLGKLDEHVRSTEHLHAALHNHVKGDAGKVAELDRLTKAHAATTDSFHNDAQALVRPMDVPPDPNALVRPMEKPTPQPK